jgi:hypothetical protein
MDFTTSSSWHSTTGYAFFLKWGIRIISGSFAVNATLVHKDEKTCLLGCGRSPEASRPGARCIAWSAPPSTRSNNSRRGTKAEAEAKVAPRRRAPGLRSGARPGRTRRHRSTDGERSGRAADPTTRAPEPPRAPPPPPGGGKGGQRRSGRDRDCAARFVSTERGGRGLRRSTAGYLM